MCTRQVATESTLRHALTLATDMVERGIPTVLVGMKLGLTEDSQLFAQIYEQAEKFAQDTPGLVAHIPSCSPLCRISVSDIYLTIAVMTIDQKARTPPRRRSSGSSTRTYSSNASSDTDLMSASSLFSVSSLPCTGSTDAATKPTSAKRRRSSTSRLLLGAGSSLVDLYEI